MCMGILCQVLQDLTLGSLSRWSRLFCKWSLAHHVGSPVLQDNVALWLRKLDITATLRSCRLDITAAFQPCHLALFLPCWLGAKHSYPLLTLG